MLNATHTMKVEPEPVVWRLKYVHHYPNGYDVEGIFSSTFTSERKLEEFMAEYIYTDGRPESGFNTEYIRIQYALIPF